MGHGTYSGVVGQGEGRAKRLGFPTINIPLSGTEHSGVYAAEVLLGEDIFPAVAFADQRRGVLEAHLLDFSADLYGKDVTVVLYEKIRDSMRFETDDALSERIAADAEEARAYFQRRAERA